MDASTVHQVLESAYKGNKTPGLSAVPTQSVKHLYTSNDGILSMILTTITATDIPIMWNITCITPLHKKETKADTSNYHPVSVMGPLAKLLLPV